MTIDERLDRLAALVEANGQQIAANSQQIAAHDQQIAAHDQQIAANGQQIAANGQQIAELRADFQAGMAELRESQALLVQILSQQQDELREYKRTTNAALDRIDRTLNYLISRLDNGSRE